MEQDAAAGDTTNDDQLLEGPERRAVLHLRGRGRGGEARRARLPLRLPGFAGRVRVLQGKVRRLEGGHGSAVRPPRLPAPLRARHQHAGALPGPGSPRRALRRFGPLRMWHVAMNAPEVCRGFACVVFQRREDAEKAIDELNCYHFDGRGC